MSIQYSGRGWLPPFPVIAVLAATLTLWVSAARLCAQSTPPGFATALLHLDNYAPTLVRGFAWDAVRDIRWVGVGANLEVHDANVRVRIAHRAAAGDTLATVVAGNLTRTVYAIDLRSGRIAALPMDPGPKRLRKGVSQTFDLVEHPSGALLVSANPDWPAPSAANGVWAIDTDPRVRPREIIQLRGPSGPLLLDRAGDLVVIEILPPPSGGTRLLLFREAQLSGALTPGAAPLTSANAVLLQAGLPGGYDLAEDARGGILVTNPASGALLCTTPDRRGLQPGVRFDLSGHSLLQLQWVTSSSALPA